MILIISLDLSASGFRSSSFSNDSLSAPNEDSISLTPLGRNANVTVSIQEIDTDDEAMSH